jgi:hypothetical protein
VRHKSTREEDDKEGQFIADRINKERPCRTLFVRNLKVRPLFSQRICSLDG